MDAFLYHINVLSQKSGAKSYTTSVCRIEESLVGVFEQICENIDQDQTQQLIAEFITQSDKFLETGEFSYQYKRKNPQVPSDPIIETKITLQSLFHQHPPIESKLVSEIAA